MQIKKERYSIVNPTFILTVETCVAEIAPWKIKKRLNDTTLSTGTRAHMSTNTIK